MGDVTVGIGAADYSSASHARASASWLAGKNFTGALRTAAGSKPASQPMSGAVAAPEITIARREHIHLPALLPERREEAGAELQPIVKTNRISPNSFTKSSM
jgi:hypothetical protein